MQKYGVIIAGGNGTRFWPLSRKNKPKQLLNLSGKDVMVNEAAKRLQRVVEKENVFLTTNAAQAEEMKRVTKNTLLPENILIEPAMRNTTACIGYAAIFIQKNYGDAIMVITPSDANVKEEQTFVNLLKIAVTKAEETDKLITLGVTPTFAATGYGYIHQGRADGVVKPVLQFVEKPDKATAEKYIKSGEYVWNTGIFVWKASVILQKIKEFLPDIYEGLCRIAQSFDTPQAEKVIKEIYPTLRSISIDYGVLEKCKDFLVVSGEFGWSDVGSWDMLGSLHPADENKNVAVGDTFLTDCKNCVVYATQRTVALVGVENLVVVETPDAVLVCPKDRAQDVKIAVELLQKSGREELL